MISAKVLATTLVLLVHEWYPTACCNDKDCRPVSCKELIIQDDGSVKYKELVFTKEKKKVSMDGDCHACYSSYPICVFFPAGS